MTLLSTPRLSLTDCSTLLMANTDSFLECKMGKTFAMHLHGIKTCVLKTQYRYTFIEEILKARP